ncbi:unnamed protein product [Schistocephalus solidus]|uniref:Uncharacterized protein n=1 Tax=Schistocephalus solidus TaxID=70667 RepID=A0A183TEB2_SCHSO|nr:unnamed protein product [Schistocephalus solidus]
MHLSNKVYESTQELFLIPGQHGFDESSEPEGLGLSFPSDDEVLHQLYTFNYLHPAMLSRQSESAYLRGVVQKLLPHLLIPPILAPPSGARRITGTQAGQNRNLKANNPNFSNLAYVSAQFYHQLPKLTSTTFNTKSMTEGDTRTPVDNCAFSFLTELLANHVLLPALDSVANPDLSGQSPGNRQNPSEGLQCCLCLHTCNQSTQKLEELHALDDNSTMETRWCQLRNVIQSTVDVLGRAHQDWFDDNDTDIRGEDSTTQSLNGPSD